MRFVHILNVVVSFRLLSVSYTAYMSVHSVLSRHILGGGIPPPPQLRILRPRTWGEVYYYVNVIPESLGLVLKINKVTVIIYSLTCGEASFLAARA